MFRTLLLFIMIGALLVSPLHAQSQTVSNSLATGTCTLGKLCDFQPGHRLLIYYGIPEGVNEAWNVEKASEVFSNYDVIVFGAGLEESEHKFHQSTASIINLVQQLSPKTVFYGYIDLGVTTNNFSLEVIKSKATKWKAMGAAGVFYDDAGNDYGVNRQRLNEAITIARNLQLSTFINAWDPDDVFSDEPDKTYNPKGIRTIIGPADIYLAEDFLQPTDIDSSNAPSVFTSSFNKKMDKLMRYRIQTGVHLMSVSVMSYANNTSSALRKFFRLNEAAAGVFSFDGYTVAPDSYSAGRIDRNAVREFPYLSYYQGYLNDRGAIVAKYNNQDYARGPFRIHSILNDHYYVYPKP